MQLFAASAAASQLPISEIVHSDPIADDAQPHSEIDLSKSIEAMVRSQDGGRFYSLGGAVMLPIVADRPSRTHTLSGFKTDRRSKDVSFMSINPDEKGLDILRELQRSRTAVGDFKFQHKDMAMFMSGQVLSSAVDVGSDSSIIVSGELMLDVMPELISTKEAL